MSRLQTATRLLVQGKLNAAVKTMTEPAPFYIDPTTYTTPTGNGNWFAELFNGGTGYFRYANHASCVEAYRRCPPVAAIIDRKAATYINGTTWVLNTQGKARDKVSTSEAATRLTNLFHQPNPYESGKQFEAKGYSYLKLFGFNIVLMIKPVGFDRTWTTAMYNIPASWLDIKETNRLWFLSGSGQIEYIVLNYNGTRVKLNIDDILIQKDTQPSFDTAIFPSSKLEPLSTVIDNIIGAYESRKKLIQYRGALGILTYDQGSGQYAAMAMTPDEKEDLQKDFRKYGLTKNQWQVIITSASMRWQQMGYATKDLMLFEEIEDGICRLCDGLGYPDFLISSRTKTTFDNVREGNKILYQDFTIPDANSIYEQWNNWFSTGPLNLRIDKDYGHVPILQEDKGKMAVARKALNDALLMEWDTNQLTLNEWRVKNGEDPLPGDKGGDLYKNEYNEKFGTKPETPDAGAANQAEGGNQGETESSQSNNN